MYVIRIGEQFSLKVRNLKKYSIGNRNIISARALRKKNKLLVKGKKAGYSDLIYWTPRKTHNLRFQVIENLSTAKAAELLKDLQELEGVTSKLSGNQVLVRGRLLSVEDVNRFHEIYSLAPTLIRNQSEISQETIAVAMNALFKKIRRQGHSQIQFQQEGRDIVMKGQVDSEEEKRKILRMTKRIWSPIRSQIKVTLKPSVLIRTRVYFLEVSHGRNQQFGLNWDEIAPDVFQFTDRGLQGAYRVSAALEQHERKGRLRILAQPEVSFLSKEKAQVFAGGEIPIRLISENSANIQWKPFGLNLKIQGLGANHHRIRLKIESEMSNINWADQVEGLPALSKSLVSSTLDFESGRPTFLSGLLKKIESKYRNGVPLLSRIPLLGLLFGSRSKKDSHSELVLGLLPEIVKKAPALKNRWRFQQESKYVDQLENRQDRIPNISPEELAILKKEGML
jgi:pilus assembly protein CpaC